MNDHGFFKMVWSPFLDEPCARRLTQVTPFRIFRRLKGWTHGNYSWLVVTGCHHFLFSQKCWECQIIPIDEVIFFRGVAQTTNQYILIVWDIYFGGSSHIYIYLLIWNDLEFPEGYLNDIYYEKYWYFGGSSHLSRWLVTGTEFCFSHR